MSRGGAILASLLVTIGRPGLVADRPRRRSSFAAASSSSSCRSSLLPSPLAISNVLAPVIVPVALGRIGPDAIAVFVGTVVLLSGWILVGGWIAAATDLALIREARPPPSRRASASPRRTAPRAATAAGPPRRAAVGVIAC